MYIIAEAKELMELGLISPLKDRAKYVLALDEYGEIKGDKYYKEYVPMKHKTKDKHKKERGDYGSV